MIVRFLALFSLLVIFLQPSLAASTSSFLSTAPFGLLQKLIIHRTDPTSFCKCTCFKTNSTIIALDPPVAAPHSKTNPRAAFPLLSRSPFLGFAREDQEDSLLPGDIDEGKDPPPGEKPGGDRKELRAGNCNDCNRAECIKYNPPGCEGAGLDDVYTTCFRMFTPHPGRRTPLVKGLG